jgi:hypothetical protein
MVYLIILVSVLMRFVPHLHNFSPVYGALLFGGANLKKRDSLWFPVVLLVASDFVLTNLIYHLHTTWHEVFQAAAFASIVMVGWLLRERTSWTRFATACFAGPLAFFLISNFGVWYGFKTYPPNAAGLLACYIVGIPYFGRTLVSTVLFAALLFGFQEFWRSRQVHATQMN